MVIEGRMLGNRPLWRPRSGTLILEDGMYENVKIEAMKRRQGSFNSYFWGKQSSTTVEPRLSKLASLVTVLRDYYLVLFYDPQQTLFPSKYAMKLRCTLNLFPFLTKICKRFMLTQVLTNTFLWGLICFVSK